MNHYPTHHSFTHTQHATHLAVPKKERKQEGVEEVIFNNPAEILSGIALPPGKSRKTPRISVQISVQN